MFIRFPTAPQSTDWYQCQPHRSIKRISLLPQWFMKVITPTLTRFPRKSACSSTLAKCSVCALGETGAETILWNSTGNTEQSGGHRAHAISKDNFHAGLSRSSCTVGSNGSPLCHTSCHEEHRDGMKSRPTEELLAPSPALLQDFTQKNHLYTAGTQTLPTTPSISVCLTHTHTYFLFSCWQETPYLEGYALLWYICFWSTEWLLESGILNFQEEECYSHSKLWSLFPEHINCLLSFSLSWPL